MTRSDRRDFLQHSLGALAAVALTPSLAELAPLAGRRADLTVAIVGAGRQGRAMLQELSKIDGVVVAAICDTDEGRLKKALRRLRGLRGYATLDELLEKEADVAAVLVATPTHLHRSPAAAALAAGKHVYCEAPLAASVEDSAAIAKAARASDKVFAAGFLARSNPVYRLARSFFVSGTLRDLAYLRAQDDEKSSWRVASPDPEREKLLNWRLDEAVSLGLPGELGSHQFDAFSWFLGAYPTSVRGWGSVRVHDDGRKVADTVTCELGYDDGLRMQWASTLGNSYDGRYEVYKGSMASFKLAWTHGWMFKEADAPTQGWEVYANRQNFHNDEGITLIADATKLAAQGKLKDGIGLTETPLYYGLADFVKCIADGASPACGAEAAHRSTVVGVAAARATVSGDEVEIAAADLELR